MKELTAAALLAWTLSACASVTPIAYAPQPARIADPAAEAKALILANTVQGCIAEPEASATMFVVKFVCSGESGGVGNSVVRFKDVQSITLDQQGEWYRVLVKHGGGANDFFWTSKSLDDMQRLADALTALSAAGAPAAEPAPGASSI